MIGEFPFASVPRLGQSEELKVAWECAAMASDLMIANYGKELKAEEKGHGDFVLLVDRQIDQRVRKLLQMRFPNDGILSEEGDEIPSRSGRTWIVDPLDGTAAYMMRVDPRFCSCMVALAIEKRITLSFVSVPLVKTTFAALENGGAYIHRDGRTQQVKVRTAPHLKNAWIECNRYSDAKYESAWFRDIVLTLRSSKGAALVTTQVPHSNVSCWMCNEGPHAVVHDNNPAKIKQDLWDLAAPYLFVREAGGVVLNAAGNQLNPFAPEPAIFACSEALAMELVAAGRPTA